MGYELAEGQWIDDRTSAAFFGDDLFGGICSFCNFREAWRILF